jgi:heterocyst specific transport system permease protein
MIYRLAWYLLVKEKRRLLAAIAGITFAALLQLMQFGFREAMYSSGTGIHRQLAGDLVMISSQYEHLLFAGTVPRQRLYQALAWPGVSSVVPVYFGSTGFKSVDTHEEHRIFVLAYDPNDIVLTVPSINANIDCVKVPDVAIFDAQSRPEFGPVVEQFQVQHAVTTEVGGRRTTIQGLFDLGVSFGVSGTVIVSDTTFRQMFHRPEGIIEIGLIRVKPGSDVATVQSGLVQQLEPDVKVLMPQQFVALEIAYWDEHTPIGFVFLLGVLIGLFVGGTIVYQILYTDVSDHLREYATLKAVGYADWQLYTVVLEEALVLSICSFPFGLSLSMLLYRAARDITHLPIAMTVSRGVLVFMLTVAMCAVAGGVAMHKLKAADPAEIF